MLGIHKTTYKLLTIFTRVRVCYYQGNYVFVQLAFNFCNGVTDTLESSTILIYFSKHMSLYTQKVGRMPPRLYGYLKVDERGASGVVN
jgi:hypothetical protein